MDINRFTEKSREALTTAQGLAAQYGHQEVDAEHLALALVNQEDGFVPRVLERVGVERVDGPENGLVETPLRSGPAAEGEQADQPSVPPSAPPVEERSRRRKKGASEAAGKDA